MHVRDRGRPRATRILVSTPLLYLRTARHLRASQMLARLRFKAMQPTPDLRRPPASRQPTAAWRCAPARTPRLLRPDRARFLNEEHVIAGANGWNDASREKLWLYNLHYFDDLSRADAEAWRDPHDALMRRWVAENPPAAGNGWEPYPLSLRIVNWIKWALAGGTLDEALRQSLAVQARYLSRRLERHLLGNHLLANAKALIFAGLYFEGEEADGWRRVGLRVLDQEINEQVLNDGGHYERSPMYHAIVLEDALDLVNVTAVFSGGLSAPEAATLARWREAVPRMITWLGAMTHPDGRIAFFNDAAFGVAATLDELAAYAKRLGITARTAEAEGLVRLAQSGYARLALGSAVLLADVAPVGLDCNPGHAHADTLSFELSLFRQRVVVNGGTSRYGMGPQRDTERGTAAHSTVEIDGENSSEVWAGFRVARRAKPFGLETSTEHSSLRLSCAHDGYRRLTGRPVHRRSWALERNRLRVEDYIQGEFRSAIARLHLHPDVVVSMANSADAGTLRLPGGQEARWRVAGGRASIKPDIHCPEFGRRIESRCLEVRFDGATVQTELVW